MYLAFLTGLLYLFFVPYLTAQDTVATAPIEENIEPDRPGFGDAVFLVPSQKLILETGIMYEWGHPEQNLYSDVIYWNITLLRYGLNKNVELRFDYNICQSILLNTLPKDDIKEEKIGLLPMRAGFKAKLLEHKKWVPAISFIGMMGIPSTATKNLRTPYVTADIQLSFANPVSKWLTIAYNLGANFDGYSANPTYYYALSAEMDFTKQWGGYAQGRGFWQTTHTTNGASIDHTPAIEGGILFFPMPNIQLDISAGLLFLQNTHSLSGFITGGFSWRLPK